MTVTGPAADVARFRTAACGAAAIPWRLDLDAEEARLVARMAGSGAGARLLARELREAVAAHHDRVAAQSARGGACPLDLHRLVPVPDRILRLGPRDPESRRWLWAHWGTLRPLRHVRVVEAAMDRRLRRSASFPVAFMSADWTPWRAVARMRAEWSTLAFDVRPEYRRG